MSINRVIICGNLTRDGELRTTASGTSILNLGIAVNERYRNPATGEWEDRPNYFDCVMFGSRASGLSQYMTRGQKVVIDGKLRWSQWEKDGQKRSKVEIIVDELEFAGSRNSSSQGSQPSAAAYGAGGFGSQQQSYNQSAGDNQFTNGVQFSNSTSFASSDTSQNAGVTPAVSVDSSVYDEDIPF